MKSKSKTFKLSLFAFFALFCLIILMDIIELGMKGKLDPDPINKDMIVDITVEKFNYARSFIYVNGLYFLAENHFLENELFRRVESNQVEIIRIFKNNTPILNVICKDTTYQLNYK